jgi:hypothetical protein
MPIAGGGPDTMLKPRATTAITQVSRFSGVLWCTPSAGWRVPDLNAARRPRVARSRASASRRGLLVALAVLILAACGGGPSKVQARLLAAATHSGRPAYFLGARYGKLPLDDMYGAEGEVSAFYGTCHSGWDSTCGPPLDVRTSRFTRQRWLGTASCQRLADVRGVPAFSSEESLQLLTASSIVSIMMTPYDPFSAEKAASPERNAASALRAVGTSHPSGDLPPPTAAVMRVVDEGCPANSE